MLVGLLLMLRWDKLGVLVTILATVAFFAVIGMNRFPTIALINLLPMACFAVSWLRSTPRLGEAPHL